MGIQHALPACCADVAQYGHRYGLCRYGGRVVACPPGTGRVTRRLKQWDGTVNRGAAYLARALYTALLCLSLLPVGGATSNTPAAITGLTATLEDEWLPSQTGDVAEWTWQTHWVLHWQPVPAATHYEITHKTSEGINPRTTSLRTPSWKIEVAKGKNPRAAGMPTRTIQLLTIQGLLAVRVAPRFADGRLGTPSPWLAVGRVYAENASVPDAPQDAIVP